ncbi:immunity protein Imm33 domain-containing protein [Aureibaculum conchae]|uniref:immunity protein Imm33 domain-containing protein n=1 Tax=Aureibaculum sp. 2308TA14-22 TaxID=3108392 RepID=UPI003397A45C
MNKKIKISRSDLIAKCDQYLNGEIVENDFENYAWELITEDYFDWDDEIISDIVYQWDSPELNFPITKKNIQLWKHQLETGEDLLKDYNLWDVHIDLQKEICEKYKSKWNPINKKLKIGIGSDLNFNPIHGLRRPKEEGTTGWYIWAGEYSECDDFFKPIYAEHLLQIRPDLIKYFGLDIGYRFLIDKKGCEDVWFDGKLKTI